MKERQTTEDLEDNVLQNIGEHIKEIRAKEKCKEALFGELIACKLKKMLKVNCLRAKNDINNVLFKYEMLEISTETRNLTPQITDNTSPTFPRESQFS